MNGASVVRRRKFIFGPNWIINSRLDVTRERERERERQRKGRERDQGRKERRKGLPLGAITYEVPLREEGGLLKS